MYLVFSDEPNPGITIPEDNSNTLLEKSTPGYVDALSKPLNHDEC
jgi:hypothetical protein